MASEAQGGKPGYTGPLQAMVNKLVLSLDLNVASKSYISRRDVGREFHDDEAAQLKSNCLSSALDRI